MKKITQVCEYNGHLYFSDEDETVEICVDYKIIPGSYGDWYNPPEPAELELTDIIYYREDGIDKPFDEKEVFDAIDEVSLEDLEISC